MLITSHSHWQCKVLVISFSLLVCTQYIKQIYLETKGKNLLLLIFTKTAVVLTLI